MAPTYGASLRAWQRTTALPAECLHIQPLLTYARLTPYFLHPHAISSLLEIPLQLIPSPDSLLQDSTSCVSSSLHFSGHLGKDTHPDVDSLILTSCACLVCFKSVHCHYLQWILQEAEELNRKWHGVFPILMTVSSLYISFWQNMIAWNIEVSLSWE